MTEIKFHLLSKNYSHNQKTLTALTDIHFSIETHAFTVLLGPEKAGKTTLLRILAGLEKPTVGKIQFPLDHNEKPQSVGMVLPLTKFYYSQCSHVVATPLQSWGLMS